MGPRFLSNTSELVVLMGLSTQLQLRHFRAARPKIGCQQSHHNGESDAELSQDVFRAVRVCSHGVEELLDEVVAGSVQNDAGPQAAGLQA